MPSSGNNEGEIRVYAKRWWILMAMCVSTTICLLIMKSFYIARDVYIFYFTVDPLEWDWVSLGGLAGAVALFPVFAWLTYANIIRLRLFAITGTFCQVVFCIVIVMTILHPNLYRMMLAFSVVQGVTYSVSVTAVPLFAVLWFPENQVGIAIACNVASISAGSLLGDVIPAQILPLKPDNITTHNATAVAEWSLATKNILLRLYGPLGVVAVLLLLFAIIFITDLPLHPPSQAQLLRRQIYNNFEQNNRSFWEFLYQSKELLFDATFIFCTVVIGIMYSTSIETLTLSQIIHDNFLNEEKPNLPPDVISSYIISANLLASFLSSFASAFLLRKFNKMKTQAVLGSLLALMFATGILLSYVFRNITGLLVFNIVFGIATRICGVPLIKLFYKHTFPIDETFVSVWNSGINCITLLVIAEVARCVMTFAGALAIFIYLCAIWVISLGFTLLIKPRNNAQEQNILNAPTERTPLLPD